MMAGAATSQLPPHLHEFKLHLEHALGEGSYLTQSVFEVILQKSISIRIRQLILYIRHSIGYVDGFVGNLTSAKRL